MLLLTKPLEYKPVFRVCIVLVHICILSLYHWSTDPDRIKKSQTVEIKVFL